MSASCAAGGGHPSSLPSSGGGVCRVPLDEAGLLWDGICLAFLLMQKRLFTSYYFHHLIIEILAQQQLASRGAEMIHEIQMKDVQASASVTSRSVLSTQEQWVGNAFG